MSLEKVGVLAHVVNLAPRGKPWCASVRGKLWRHVEDYYVYMHMLKLALCGKHTHSKVHMGCASIT